MIIAITFFQSEQGTMQIIQANTAKNTGLVFIFNTVAQMKKNTPQKQLLKQRVAQCILLPVVRCQIHSGLRHVNDDILFEPWDKRVIQKSLFCQKELSVQRTGSAHQSLHTQ
ncbi:hypothetical protein P0Y67_16205 [Photobacterium sp. SP02]|uniref:hypothetical protein n=1 Tax=Photobacterium sp. SP02 TaxID=3032280 RepID=UPI003144FA58